MGVLQISAKHIGQYIDNQQLMKTAEEFLENIYRQYESDDVYIPEWVKIGAIEYARYQVQEALDQAYESATMNLNYPEPYEDSNETGLTFVSIDDANRGGEYSTVEIDKKSITKSYSLENIK